MNINVKRLNQLIKKNYLPDFKIAKLSALFGGDINKAYLIESIRGEKLFIKLNHAQYADMFQQELYNIHTIEKSASVKTPKCIQAGNFDELSFLLMEYIDIQASGNEFTLGTQLAKMHLFNTQYLIPSHLSEAFGFHNDNYIGSTTQANTWSTQWSDFWIEQRLHPQLKKAAQNGFKSIKLLAQENVECTTELLANHRPKASVLHGDLWSGNKGYTDSGEAIIFDPASYIGDRETDIALTELFGGFSKQFYEGYHSQYPLSAGYEQRKIIYMLYHQLNHLNLFGSSYEASCINAMKIINTMKASH